MRIEDVCRQLPAARPRRPSGRLLVRLCLMSLVAGGAQADQGDLLNFTAGVSHLDDSNLFRLASGVDPRPLVGSEERGDRVTTTSFGVNLRKSLSMQQFEANWDHFSNRYARYGFLDSDINNGRLAWLWQLTPEVRGNLSHSRTQALLGFADYTNYGVRNLRKTTVHRADADWSVFRTGWHLRAGIDRYEIRNSETFSQDEGSQTDSGDVAVRHVFASGNWADVFVRAGSGEFLGRSLDAARQLDTGFAERRYEFRMSWSHGKSSLLGGVGYARRQYDHFSGRNYGEPVGNLSWTWAASDKSALRVAWRRDLLAYTDQSASYYRQDVFSVKPVWQIDSKLRLSANVDHARRDYRGAIAPVAWASRDERVTTARLEAEWAPWRALFVNAYVVREKRDSSLPAGDYSARQLGLGLRAEF
ncbi:MAG: outer membrane beta-barrel protein [Dechloromonas sp.]|nr:MAG: outer membrane beta-barrel protein [Dechloromonas sp.]